MSWLKHIKVWAKRIKRDVLTLWLAAKDPRVPTHAKILAAVVAAYALSPIDLIPDFIPILGYLDDLIIVPFGIILTLKLIPPQVLSNLRTQATQLATKPTSRAGLFTILLIWLTSASVILWITLK